MNIQSIGVKLVGVFIGVLVMVSAWAGTVHAAETFSYETVAGGFVLPTSFSFVDADRFIVGEKGGNVYMVDTANNTKDLIYTVPSINTFNDRGLIGLTLHNDFLQNGYMYLSYTHDNSPSNNTGAKTARIVRVTYNHTTGLVEPSSYTILVGAVAGTPEKPSCDDYPAGSDCIASNSGAHSAGGLRFGPDGYLYASIGDGSDFYTVDPHALNSLNLDALTGKILRLNEDGIAPATNPYYEPTNPTSNRSKVFASGIRNSFRFDFTTGGDLIAGEVGWSTREELNLVNAGDNFGWPCYEGVNPQGGYSVVFPSECATITNHEPPMYQYGHGDGQSYSVTAGAEVTAPAYGSYAGKYLFGDYSQNWIQAADYSNGTISSVEVILDNPGGPVDMQVDDAGFMYYLAIYTGEVRKLIISGNEPTTNRSPVADYYVEYTLGDAPSLVTFHGELSSDPDNNIASYVWDFGDGGTATGVTPSHTYLTNGTFTTTLTVTDSEGLQSVHVAEVIVGEIPYNAAPILTNTEFAPSPLYVGLNADITATFTNEAGGSDDYILYIEVYNSSNQQVLKTSELISSTETGDISRVFTWLPPGIDTYRVAIGFFSDDWRNVYAWHNEALLFAVEQRDSEDNSNPDPTPEEEETDEEPEEEQSDPENNDPDPEPETPECYDWDGDGWGWDGEKGCRVDQTPAEEPEQGEEEQEEQEQEEQDPENNDPESETTTCPPESDHDGDGWGWDGTKGCRVGEVIDEDPEDEPEQEEETESNDPEPEADTCPAESDHDGDGWGWDGEKGCRVDQTPAEEPEQGHEEQEEQDPEPETPECYDWDGDGWGWDGEKGCRIS